MKYIKKFDMLNQADGYVIPNPFIGHVENGQLIANNEDNKKLEVENGKINIITAEVEMITFRIHDLRYEIIEPEFSYYTYTVQKGTTIRHWVESGEDGELYIDEYENYPKTPDNAVLYDSHYQYLDIDAEITEQDYILSRGGGN